MSMFACIAGFGDVHPGGHMFEGGREPGSRMDMSGFAFSLRSVNAVGTVVDASLGRAESRG